MTPDDGPALGLVRAACVAAYEAEEMHLAAVTARREVLARVWPVIFWVGPRQIAASAGVSESKLKQITADLRPRPAKGPTFGRCMTPVEVEAVETIRAAFDVVEGARVAHAEALNVRWRVVREHWRAVHGAGYAQLAREIGVVGEGTLRNAVADLRRAAVSSDT